MDNDEDLKKTISQLSNEQLATMLAINSAEYRKEALELAEAELKVRGISGSVQIEEILSLADRDQECQLGSALDSSHAELRSGHFHQLRLPKWPLFTIDDRHLKKTISELTDEQLAKMLTIESSEYRPEALALAEAQLKTRGLSLSALAQEVSSVTAQDQEEQCIPCLQPPDLGPPSPFIRLRSRTLPIWMVSATTLFLCLTHGRGGEVFFLVEFYAMIAVWICWQRVTRNIDSSRLFGPVPRDPKMWAFVALAIPLLALNVGTGWIMLWLRYYLNLLFGSNPVTKWLGRSSQIGFSFEFWTVIRTLQIIAYGPIVEELVFRSLLLHRWAQKWGVRAALVSTSLAFALIHPNPIGFFIFGLLMAVLYLCTRSLWIPIACHGTYNALVVLRQTLPAPHLNGMLCFVLAVPAFLLVLKGYWPDEKMPLPYFDRPASVSEPRAT